MNMNWLEHLLYGFISGLTEFVPVSSQAHQTLFFRLMGGSSSGVLSLFVHLGALIAVLFSYRQQMARLHRELRLAQIPRKRRRRSPDHGALVEISLLRTASVLLMAGFLLYIPASGRKLELHMVALFLLLNGAILYAPIVFATGNKAAASMSRFDSVLIGLGGCLGMLPGVSPIAAMTSVCSVRGAEREKALGWVYLLSIPMLACLVGFDFRQIILEWDYFSIGFGGFMNCLLAGGAAYLGGLAGIQLMRFISVHGGYHAFAFYSWGGALFSFILYLSS